MSQLRNHLESLYETRDDEILKQCLAHADFKIFMETHQIVMPLEAFVEAFTHTSFAHEYHVPHQELLEFLGDSVLQLTVTGELYKLFPKEKEGKLSKLRSAIVNEKTLSLMASSLNLGSLILVGKGEFKKGLYKHEAVLADTIEALLGQVYLYQGFAFAQGLFLKWLKQFVPEALENNFADQFDAKSKLQEASLARYKKLPRYAAEAVGNGFQVKLFLNDELKAEGHFTSKKNGEKELAQQVLEKKLI